MAMRNLSIEGVRLGAVLMGVVLATAGCPLARAQQTAAGAGGAAVSTMSVPAASPDLSLPVAQLTPLQVAAMQKKLADWGQLGRYRDEDLKLGEAATGQQRVVFYGDSITDNWGRRFGKFFPDEPWVNRGISGQTTPQMLVRFQQDVVALHPAVVVILAGINDIAGNTGPESLGEIEAYYRGMVTLAQANHIAVVISSVLPAAAFPWHRGVDPRAEVVALNAWLKQFANEQGAVWLDYYPAMVGADGGMKAGLSVDGVHPNDAGYAVMEPMAKAAVMKALGASGS